MKTARSIAEQEERKAARGDADDQASSLPTDTEPVSKKSRYEGYADRIAPWRWKPGQPGNPTGKNTRNDLAREIAAACFENNAEALYKAFSKALLKGNPYCFKELSDRVYGRLKERIEVEAGPLRNMSDDDLEKRAAELQRQIGLTSALERVTELERELQQLRALPAASNDSEVN